MNEEKIVGDEDESDGSDPESDGNNNGEEKPDMRTF